MRKGRKERKMEKYRKKGATSSLWREEEAPNPEFNFRFVFYISKNTTHPKFEDLQELVGHIQILTSYVDDSSTMMVQVRSKTIYIC